MAQTRSLMGYKGIPLSCASRLPLELLWSFGGENKGPIIQLSFNGFGLSALGRAF